MKWWDQSWNPVVGCSKCSPGCTNCYAETLHTQRYDAKQAGKKVSGKCYEKPFSQIQLLEERLDIPMRRKIPTVYFVNSMSDLFHPDVPFEFIDKVFATIAINPQHTFLVLTKRAGRMREYYNRHVKIRTEDIASALTGKMVRLTRDWPLSNAWLGVTVCNQAEADKNIPLLLQTPAAHRFLSIEPMLGEIDIRKHLTPRPIIDCAFAAPVDLTCTNEDNMTPECHNAACPLVPNTVSPAPEINQVILGGETGKNARPMHPEWAQSIRDQCKEAGVPFFLKQLGLRKLGRVIDGVEHNDLAWSSNVS